MRLPLLVATLTVPAVPASAQGHLFGESPNSRFGWSVDVAGDLDGDGHDDIVVGAPWDSQNGFRAGSVSAISLRKGAVLWRHYGGAEGDQLGTSVSGAGDVDGDGFDDVIVGIPFDDTAIGADAGAARLLSGFDGSVIYHWTGYAPGDRLGTSVDGGMDLDLDGWPDMVVGATYGGDSDPSQGKKDQGEVHVISGRGLYRMLVVEGEFLADTFGASVAMIGDVDGDEHPDWAAGAPLAWRADGGALGYVRVHSGADGSLIEHVPGMQDGAEFGGAIAAAGDVDGDGRPDIVVGAPRWSSTPGSLEGRAQVLSVPGYSILNDVVGPAGSQLGTSVAGLGDASGDGRADIAVGAPRYSPHNAVRGAVFVWRGDVAILVDAWEGAPNASLFGTSVVGLGNLNRHWAPEVLIGLPQGATAGPGFGEVVVRSVQ